MSDISMMQAAWNRVRKVISYGQEQAVSAIVAALEVEPNPEKAVIVASAIADEAGITRSTICGALNLLEAAGIVETKSMGMKGTLVKVKCDEFFAEGKKLAAA